MKQLLNIIILGCMLTLTACDKFLDVVPVGSVIPSTQSEFRALLARSYKDVSTLRDRGMACLRTYELKALEGEYSNFDAFRDIENWNDDGRNPNSYSFEWQRYYNIIFISNEVIAAGKGMKDGTPEGISQLVAEAYTLRAYMHFILVNLFGQPYGMEGAGASKAIPLKLDNNLEGVLKRNTLDEVYAAIQMDLDKAYELMNVEQWEANYVYRFNTIALDALQAKVYLYTQRWEDCLKCCNKVLGKKNTLEDFNKAEALQPTAIQSVENILALEQSITSGFKQDMVVMKEFAEKYGEGDLRLGKYFGAPESNGTLPIVKGGSNEYLCSFRTGEVMLTAAEAAARLNQMSVAKQHLLKLMQHRYTQKAYEAKKKAVDAMNQQALTDEILAERERELALEGHSWFDLRRTTRPQLTKVIDGKQYVLEHNDPRYTLQIPQEALDVNPGLRN